MILWPMGNVCSDDQWWPPAVFREIAVAGNTPGSRRFQLVDVVGAGTEVGASIAVTVAGRTWVVTDGAADSAALATRLVAEVIVEAVRAGAARLRTAPACPATISRALLELGGSDRESAVSIDL